MSNDDPKNPPDNNVSEANTGDEILIDEEGTAAVGSVTFFDSLSEDTTPTVSKIESPETTIAENIKSEAVMAPGVEAALTPGPTPEAEVSPPGDLKPEVLDALPVEGESLSEELPGSEIGAFNAGTEAITFSETEVTQPPPEAEGTPSPSKPDDQGSLEGDTAAGGEAGAGADEAILTPESLKASSPVAGVDSGRKPEPKTDDAARPEIVETLVTKEKIEKLWARADEVQKSIFENITTLPIARKMLDYIQSARNQLLAGYENYEEAERYLNEVEFRIALSKNLKSLSKGFTLVLYLYEVVWAVFLILFLIYVIGVDAAFASTLIEGTPDLNYLLSSMVWGGFGGVIGALLALVKHISIEQDFDRQHIWWYRSSPTIGIGIGAVVYLFMHVGLYAIVGAEGDIASPIVIYVLAWLAGYQQNVFTDLVKRMMKTLLGEERNVEEEDLLQPKK